MIVPVSAILPTRNRAPILARFLETLFHQEVLPAEIVICDASDNDDTDNLIQSEFPRWDSRVRWVYQRAARTGLAPQRNQAVARASQPFVWFLDDDILLEPGCLRWLYETVSREPQTGGATASLVNEPYHPPGRMTRALMRWFEDGRTRPTYASACVGPGWTFLHDLHGPALTPAEWMGGGCTMYRKDALPVPAVPDHFEGGAIGEDLAASLHVAKSWQTWHVRDARCLHESQGGSHKRSASSLADQGLRNRYWIMTRVMRKTTRRDHFDFALMHAFTLASLLSRPSQWLYLLPTVTGWARALGKLPKQSAHG